MDIQIQQLQEKDVTEAARIVNLAFGTFLNIPNPAEAFGDRDVLISRWKANDSGVLGAYLDDELVGSNVVSKWGSFGFFGPLTVRPDFWDKGIAGKLLVPTMQLFSKWNTIHQGLFTFAHSPKHIGLYEKFGFYPRYLTQILVKQVPEKSNQEPDRDQISYFSIVREQSNALNQCKELTSEIFEGLDLTSEIQSVSRQALGETIVLYDGSGSLASFAICHVGKGSEAGSGNCYVKFAAARTNEEFKRLVAACENYASQKGASSVEAGMNLARTQAYKEMLSCGFRAGFQGVAMQRPNHEGFNRPNAFVIDDWR